MTLRTRRRYLHLAGAGVVAGLVGCTTGGGDSDEPTDRTTTRGTETAHETPEPTDSGNATTGPSGGSSDWPMQGADPARTNARAEARGPASKPSERWRVDLRIEYGGVASPAGPIVVDGSILVGDDDGVRALSPGGHERWSVGIEGTFVDGLVATDGTLYAGEDSASAPVNVYALSPDDGSERWRRTLDAKGRAIVHAAVEDALLVQVDGAGEPTAIQARARADGQLKWTAEFEGQPLPPAVAQGRMYVPELRSNVGKVHALSLGNGETRWTVDLEGWAQVAAGQQSLFLYDYAGALVAVNHADGAEQWRFDFDGEGADLPPIALADDAVYAATADSTYALDVSTGAERWVGNGASNGIAVAGDRLYGVTSQGESPKLFALSADDGSTVWKTTVDAAGNPLAVSGGALYFTTNVDPYYLAAFAATDG